MRRYSEEDLDGMRFVGSNGIEYRITKEKSRFIIQYTNDMTGITGFTASADTALFYLSENIWIPTKSWMIEQFYKECTQ